MNHHRHEMLENRVACGTLSPQIAKSFGAQIACDRDCHVGRSWWAADPLTLELLYDVIEKGPGGLCIENVEAHDDRRKLASVIAEPFRVEIVDGVSMVMHHIPVSSRLFGGSARFVSNSTKTAAELLRSKTLRKGHHRPSRTPPITS